MTVDSMRKALERKPLHLDVHAADTAQVVEDLARAERLAKFMGAKVEYEQLNPAAWRLWLNWGRQ